jgi:hypothetical protein
MAYLPDHAPALKMVGVWGQRPRLVTTEEPACDTVCFEATSASYSDLRQTAAEMLAVLLAEATAEGRLEVDLEIKPYTERFDSKVPVGWRAEIIAEIPRAR